MGRERRGIELLRYRIDGIRSVGALGLFAFVAVAAIYAGGWQGWVIAAGFIVLVVALASLWWLRRDRYPRIPH